jgi:AraC family transcriptional regulator of adaptative response / DNA-3-methyladenine glycosylase II
VRRSLRLSTHAQAGWLQLEFAAARHQVALSFPMAWAGQCAALVRLARRWLDLDAQPQVIDEHLGALPGPPGLRLPGAADAFETAVRAILGQRITVAAACTLAQRLVERFGEPVLTPWPQVNRLFPSARRLGRAPPAALAAIGLNTTQAQAVHALAQRWPQLSALAQDVWTGTANAEDLAAALQDIHGLGPWTTQYILMRWLGWPDAHLPADVAVLKALGLPRTREGHRRAQAELARYQPWRSYAVMRLWHTLE